MIIDGLTLYAIVCELKEEIVGCRVDKVFQPVKDEIAINLRSKTSNLRLLISANAGNCRIGITSYAKKNPMQPPMFCMFLRKHLQSARISDIEQVGLERICNIHFDSKDELGISKKLILVCEFMGKYSNLILIDENDKILQSMRHVSFGMSSVRQVLPGLQYELPPSDKYNPFLVSADTFFEMTKNIANKPIDKFLVEKLQGVSSATAHELRSLYLEDDFANLSRGDRLRFIEHCVTFFEKIKNLDLKFTIQFDKMNQPKFFSVLPYKTATYHHSQTFDSANTMVDEFYRYKFISETFNKQKHVLEKHIKKALDKHIKKLRIQTSALESSKKAEECKRNGDLIMANIYNLKRGMDKCLVYDYTADENIEISLDKKLSPSANAQKFYKRYNKLKKGIEIHSKNIVGTKAEIEFLHSVQVSLDSCEDMQELDEVKYELIKAGYISQKPGTKSTKATQDASKPNEFLSSDGFKIFAGKNNRQNDILTMKTADQDDIWLHTQKIAGCHVIIKNGGKEVPDLTLFEAASIAAYYSKAKGASKIAVDYTIRKNVRKPNGSKPGYVIYEVYNTIIVDSDVELCEKLSVQK